MNFDHIGDQLGKPLLISPRPIVRVSGRPVLPWDRKLTLSEVNEQERWVELKNPATGHVRRLWGDNVKGFTRPDILELRQQIVVTDAGVELEPITAGGPDAATVAADLVQDLVQRAKRLHQALCSLPARVEGPRADGQIRHAPIWDSAELVDFQSAANKLDSTTAATATGIVGHLRYLGECVAIVRGVNRLLGYDYNQFPHRMWQFNWIQADVSFESLFRACTLGRGGL